MRRFQILALAVLLGAGLFVSGRAVALAQQQPQAAETILVIEEFDVPQGRAITEAIDDASQTVRAMRSHGEFNSVRLYTHSWGPKLALYIIFEPKSWQAIKTGTDKLFAARPELKTAPFKWGGHSDNILTEVLVR
jgi:hypothetical protein